MTAHSDPKLVGEVIQTDANIAAGNVADEGKTDENGVDANEADDNAFFEEIDIDYDVAEGNEITNTQATSELKVSSKLFQPKDNIYQMKKESFYESLRPH